MPAHSPFPVRKCRAETPSTKCSERTFSFKALGHARFPRPAFLRKTLAGTAPNMAHVLCRSEVTEGTRAGPLRWPLPMALR